MDGAADRDMISTRYTIYKYTNFTKYKPNIQYNNYLLYYHLFHRKIYTSKICRNYKYNTVLTNIYVNHMPNLPNKN